MKTLVVLLLAGMLVGCSNNKKKIEDKPVTKQAELEKSLEEADFIVDAEEGDLILEGEKIENSAKTPTEDVALSNNIQESPISQPKINEMGEYTVQKGDTLMLIAFHIYGDYRKWQGLVKLNPGVNVKGLKAGTVIKYEMPDQKFVWNPQGLPHLIKRGETLGSISVDKYKTERRWRDLWENNKPLIIDPNLIFAGFTIYYIPTRDVASQ